ncbi:HNH endonuclease [Candidatus Woesebacteria bacterium]|nr:HNH endonuclease [Candidatus Woesebacteria bacterium]
MKTVITKEIISQMGSMTDLALANKHNIKELTIMKWRNKLKIPTYRQTVLSEKKVECANCQKKIIRKNRDLKRSVNLFCSRECANQFQKTRDSETLRYGQGWKKIRQQVRERDNVCQVCKIKPQTELQVHHLIPFRMGGKNTMENLVGLCRSCHSKIEKITEKELSKLKMTATLKNGIISVGLYAPNAIASKKI